MLTRTRDLEAEALTDPIIARLLLDELGIPPISGASPDGDDGGDGDGDGDGAAASAGDGSGDGDGDGEDDFDKDRAMATIRAQRQSEEQLKQQLKDTRSELDQVKRKGLSEDEQVAQDLKTARTELETVTGERDSLQVELEAIKRDSRISAVAGRHGAHDPSDIALILSPEETEDDATTERAVKRLKKEKPHLFKPEQPSGGSITPGNGSAADGDMNDRIRQAAGRG